jgi:hypothetical protein
MNVNLKDMKYYFSDMRDELRCYTMADHIEYMRENEIPEMTVNLAKIEFGTGYFFCREFQDIGEVGESCGKQCKKYIPRNGKNGRCKHSGNCYGKTNVTKRIIL